MSPVETEELVVDFPAHLAAQLCYVSPGSHGWMFAVDKAVAAAFNTAHQSIRKVARSFGNEGRKEPLGVYKIQRWFEADMYGPEFCQFSEQDQDLLVSRLTNEKSGTSAFKAKEQALVLSQHTVTCLFLQHLPTTTVRSRNSDRTPIPVDQAGRSERVSTTSSSSTLKTNIPPTSTRRMNAQATANIGRMYEPQNKNSPTPNNANTQLSYEPPHQITVPVENGTGSAFNQGNSMPNGAPHRMITSTLNTNIPIPTIGAMASSYEPPPRITVPLLNFTPPTPTLKGAPFVRPFADSNVPRRDLLYPHRGLLATGSHPQSTSHHARNGNGPSASTSRRSPEQHRPVQPVPPMNWDQNDPSSPRGPRQQWPHNNMSAGPPPGYYDQQYFHGQKRM
ncbi:hypothetical protein B0H16DRAFT_1513588 [Mycena metata]|uniref:Uncharacterized protein n=1 Tax=Mycena metata TaxID=1033252 RepID=A0AAD7JT62_9AGAR|nr:hypothetical protein B0H16DRAFT_1513588 [Mycena metata]